MQKSVALGDKHEIHVRNKNVFNTLETPSPTVLFMDLDI